MKTVDHPPLSTRPPSVETSETLFAPPCTEADATLWIQHLLSLIRNGGYRRLVLPNGTYHFHPAFAMEEYLFISNNDEGLKRIAFFLEDWNDIEIDGQNSLLIFHGLMLPFVFRRCCNVTLRNLRIDWERSFHSEARVVEVGDGHVDLEIDPVLYPYKIERGTLQFTGEHGMLLDVDNILEFDAARRETAFQVRDNYDMATRHTAEELAPGRIRFRAEFSEPRPKVGNILALIDERRLCPGITITRSRDVLCENVTLHHAGGMGFIAQLSHNVTLRHCRVSPSPEKGRMISLRADATHFVCCSGHLLLEHCELSHQLDDPGNFHNVYAPIVQRLSPHSVIVRMQHYQQWGLELFEAGHRVEFVEAASLARQTGNEITSVKRLNREHTLLEFRQPVVYGPGWAVGSLHWVAHVTVRHTSVHSNRARGFLVTTNGKAVFEDNYFHSPGAAILIEGDAKYWYEAGAVEDVLIRRNTFENCNYGVWGRATIDINPAIEPEHRAMQRFHRNIRIEENEFITFHSNLLRAHCVDGLSLSNNHIRWTTDYPATERSERLFVCEDCSDVRMVHNTVAPSAHS